ncbi:MAG: tRNA pseudouridine(38-40) synthase TruA [Eggerthellaceae bacterium]|nr:tRNA pseudouridine(38-40) synthase TruA [Eggerthellaceae bacterium]
MPEEPTHTLALTLSYDGAPFCGFARQPGKLTVQGSLEQALRTLYKREVPTVCAGRTDAGVHARGQVVSFDVTEGEFASKTAHSLMRSLNALVHDSMAVRAAQEAPFGFSARFDAVEREYRYYLYTPQARPVLIGGHVWHYPKPLDLEAMRAGAAHLIGEHDFKSFCMAVSAEGRPTCRNVSRIDVERMSAFAENDMVRIRVVGNAFLHSMVRTIVGTLVAVGCGRRTPEWVAEALAARDRRAAGETAPAKGLVFWKVSYAGSDGSIPLVGVQR